MNSAEYQAASLELLQEIARELREMNSKLDSGLALANSPVGKVVRKATATWQGLGGNHG